MDNSGNSGLGFLETLCLIFITLKLTNYIDWGWFWILAPIIFKYVLGYGILILGWLWKRK